MARTKEELEHLIEKRGLAPKDSLKVRPLTMREINGMHEHTYAWHELCNLANVNAAINETKTKAENSENARLAKVQREFDSTASEEETNEALAEVKKFVATHPQLITSYMPNRELLVGWLQKNKLHTTQANLSTAFEELGRTGQIVLNPAAVGIIRIKTSNGRTEDICKEDLPVWQRRNGTYRDAGKTVPIPVEILPFDQTTGVELMRSPQRDRLLKAYTPTIAREFELKKMSADEWNKANPLPPSGQVVAAIAAQIEKAVLTFISFHPEYQITEENKTHLLAYLEKRKLPCTLNTLEAAYGDLVREGYIETNNAVGNTQATRMIDYAAASRGNQKTADPQLASEINSMSAEQFLKWEQNPANRARVNSAVGSR